MRALERPRFVSQESFFNRQAAAVADQFPVTSDDAVAGHDNREGVLSVRGPDCACGAGASDSLSDLSVGYRVSVRYIPEGLPDLELKLGTFRVEADLERLSFSGKVLIQLLDRLAKRQFGADPLAVWGKRVSAVLERDMCQSLRVSCQQ